MRTVYIPPVQNTEGAFPAAPHLVQSEGEITAAVVFLDSIYFSFDLFSQEIPYICLILPCAE